MQFAFFLIQASCFLHFRFINKNICVSLGISYGNLVYKTL